MDEGENVQEGTLGADSRGKELEENDTDDDGRSFWEVPSCKAELGPHPTSGSSKKHSHATEKSDTDRDCSKLEDVSTPTVGGDSSHQAENGFLPESSEDAVKSIVNTVEEVVDVSPNAFSLSDLDCLAVQGSQKVMHVQNMYVFDNRFTVLPRSVGKLKNLRSLKIFSNEVRLLPDEIGDIAQLQHLQMKVCPTGLGSLPPLGNLNCLKTLELHQTPLRPSVFSLPPEISKLHLLTRLAVCNFSISFLPPEIGELKNLEELDISFNRLKTLPKEVSSLRALKHLRAENNKLIELPSGLDGLPHLSFIDVAHNKLTSLDCLGLFSMTSLRALDAKFNKLRNTEQIPEWITCNLEGNPSSVGQITSSSEDTELLPSAVEEGDEVSSPAQLSAPTKEVAVVQKNVTHGKSKRGWKRQDVHQLKARQDRLNMSRKSKLEFMERTKDGVDDIMCRERTVLQESPDEARLLDSGPYLESIAGVGAANSDKNLALESIGNVAANEEKARQDHGAREGENGADVVTDSYSSRRAKKDVLSVNTDMGFLEEGEYTSGNGGIVIDSHSSRKVISGDRCNWPSNKQSSDDSRRLEGEGSLEQTFTFKSKEEVDTALVNGRRKGGGSDKNPKPKKRRKSAQSFSEVSYTYHSQSLCSFTDRLQDGFYDAGREHPFSSLDVLESEQPCFNSREVILVDREQDEELDVIALSAQHFLTRLELTGRIVGQAEYHGLNAFQKAAILSLFVSDCFGGSDKTLNVTNTRRAALGGSTDVPFVCSCSSGNPSPALSSLNESNSSLQGTIPTVNTLCEESVRLLKRQRQSNVVPLGSLPYGVCRHRAILFKYLCDRTSIPCELVRGYLDYVPHAWNVVLVMKGGTGVRMVVDACRPLDIREERDPEYFCRYIPFRRFQIPSVDRTDMSLLQSEEIIPLLHEEIGRGASGSVVRRCSLGSLTAAAKVHMLDQASETLPKDWVSRCLSELRILCSLGEHPHIVSFYGHQFSSVPMATLDTKQENKVFQLMLFMEYVQGCSLEVVFARYAEEGRTYLPAKEAVYIARDIVHALCFVHSRGILHRDIKSSNVLVNLQGDQGDAPLAKLCDFDSAVPLSSSSSHSCYVAHRGVPPAEVCVGTPRWMAPEVFRAMYSRHPYGLEADIWSFGCLLLEMLTLQVPYAGLPEAQIQSHIQMGQRPQLPIEIEKLVSETLCEGDQANDKSTVSDEELKFLKVLVSLFRSCTESSPHSRPTAHEAYKALSMTFDTDPGDASNGILNVAYLKEPPTSDTLLSSCLNKNVRAIDADEKHEATENCIDTEDDKK